MKPKFLSFPLKISQDLSNRLMRYIGCKRYVSNHILSLQIELFNAGMSFLRRDEMPELLSKLVATEDGAFLKEVPFSFLLVVADDYWKYVSRVFSKDKRFPYYLKKGINDDVGFANQAFPIEDNHIFIEGIGKLKFGYTTSEQTLLGKNISTIKNVHIFHKKNRWYIHLYPGKPKPIDKSKGVLNE